MCLIVVRGRSIGERAESAEQVQLLVAKPGDIDERIGARQHREERQKQDFIQRIHDLAALAWIGHILEMIEKNQCFAERFAVRRRAVHAHPRRSEYRASS